MNNFARALPFVWPHRRKLYLSFVFAGLVAVFWSLNLSVAFPVVKVLLQGQGLSEYVDAEIEVASQEIERRTLKLELLDKQLAAVEAGEARDKDRQRVELLAKIESQRSDLSTASRQALAMNWLKSYVLPWLPKDQFDTLAAILGILLLATVLKGICIFVQDLLIGSVVELTIMGIRKQCFRQTLGLDYQTLALAGTPDLMSRFTYDMEVMAHGLQLMGGKVIREPLKAIACIVGAFFISWQLTLLSLLFVPLVGLVFYRIGKKLKQASHRMMESMSRIYKTLEETFEGLKVVIAFNGAPHHRQKFHRENKAYYTKAMKIVKIDALTSPTTEVLGLVAAFLALLPGAYLVLRGTTTIWGITLVSNPMDVAELSVLYVMLAGVLDPVRKLSTTYSKLKRATAASDRVFGLIDRQPLVKQAEQPVAMPRHRRNIEFRKLCFSYAANKIEGSQRPAVLDEVSLTVRAGEVIVVVGENGSGKSTLVNLLPRFFDPDHGSILVDGVDIRQVRLRELRSQIGVVTQETLLFDQTIAENIRYGKPSASREEIEEAARRAHVTSFVDTFPDRFETRVGEKGQRLSGGQRQRIALARAMLRDPSILILDEATSAIDAQSELLIHQALRSFVKGRTTFIITHSVSQSILDFVSRIVVMDQGRIVAAGPHSALIESCPIYQRLYQAQTRQRAASPPDGPSWPGDTAASDCSDTVDLEGTDVTAAPARSSSVTEGTLRGDAGTPAEAPEPHIIPLRGLRTPERRDSSGAAS